MKSNELKVKMPRSPGIALTPKAQTYMEKRPYPRNEERKK